MVGRNGRRRLRRVTVMALATVPASACVTTGSTPDQDSTAQPTVTVMVENQNWLDATIYVDTGAQRYRLGSVLSMTAREFRVPAVECPEGLELQAEMVGSRDAAATGRLLARAGDRIDWTLGNHLVLSRVHLH